MIHPAEVLIDADLFVFEFPHHFSDVPSEQPLLQPLEGSNG